MKKLGVLLIMFLVAFAVQAEDLNMPFKVIGVYDGDTFTIRLNDASLPEIFRNISIRVKGIDTPEMKPQNARALESRIFLEGLLSRATVIEIKNIEKDKYFRLVADVYVDRRLVSEVMISRGYGVPYDGGKKQNGGS